MKYGIESGAYLVRYPFLEGMEKLVRHGYHAVDYNYLINTTTPFFTQDEEEFKTAIEAHRDTFARFGVESSQTHGPWRFPVQDATPEDRAERFEAMAKAIRGTSYLGAKYMVIHPIMPFGAESPLNPELVYELNLEYMTRLAEYAKEWGVTVCLENMPFPEFPLSRPDDIAAFVRTVNHPNFKVCLDTGHALVCGIQPAEAVAMIGGDLLATLHIHDNDGTADRHLPVGEGIMDFPAFVRALKETSYEGVINLETSADKTNALSPEQRDIAEREMLAYVKSFF